MIFEFDKSIQKGDISLLAKALLLIAEKHHHILTDVETFDWIRNDILDSTDYLGSIDRESLKTNSELWSVTGTQKNYQRQLSVGIGDADLSIQQLYTIVNEPSYVVLENSSYDWAAISRWIELYHNERNYKSLNESLYEAIKEQNLRPDHAGGGNGTIANEIGTLEATYSGKAQYKLMTIYDSDKTKIDDTDDHNKALKAYLVKSGMFGFELHKREIENYFSIETLESAGMIDKTIEIPSYTPEEYDFIDIEKAPFTKYSKKDMAKLAGYLSKESLKERVAHHKHSDSVDEIQLIIIELAKYI